MLASLISGLFFLASLQTPAARTSPDADSSPGSQIRPNIIVFLVDDLGWQDVSVPMWFDSDADKANPTEFNQRYRTPNLEKLAAQGVRFSQAYACAVCSPTRTSIMTGQNAARHHVTQWTLQPGKDPSGKTERIDSPKNWRLSGIQPDDFSSETLQTLPTLLREAGYRTIHVGKAHWGVLDSPGSDPTNLGFDVNIAGHHAGAPGSYQGEDGYGASRKNGAIWAVPGLDAYHGLPVHLTDALTIEANRAVRAAVADGKPFFLYMAHYAVHSPIQPHKAFLQKYLDQGLDAKEARYASMIEGYDSSLGSLMHTVKELGIADQTIVLFTSDNGGLSVIARGQTPMGTGANTHNLPLRAGKGSAYEGGTRIPQVVAWVEVNDQLPMQKALPVAHNVFRHESTMVEDFYPTILRWAGAKVPDWSTQKPGYEIDGLDFTRVLAPRPDELGYAELAMPKLDSLLLTPGLWHLRPLLFHYPHVWGPNSPGWGYEPHSAMRLGDWKIIYFYQPQRWELYNLAADLGESNDLAAAEPERTHKMAERLITELLEHDAQWPTNRQTDQPESPNLDALP
jgi:arylsulfatase A-like enzyme